MKCVIRKQESSWWLDNAIEFSAPDFTSQSNLFFRRISCQINGYGNTILWNWYNDYILLTICVIIILDGFNEAAMNRILVPFQFIWQPSCQDAQMQALFCFFQSILLAEGRMIPPIRAAIVMHSTDFQVFLLVLDHFSESCKSDFLRLFFPLASLCLFIQSQRSYWKLWGLFVEASGKHHVDRVLNK